MRSALIFGGLALVLAVPGALVAGKERLIAVGEPVLLELAPRDPRSLMQGDYMALRFRLEVDAFGRGRHDELEDGRLVVKVDERGVGRFARRDGGEPLAADERRLRYRVRNGRVKFATNAYFFQEGHARYYAQARYGEFRVSNAGELLLTHLRGEDLERLGPP